MEANGREIWLASFNLGLEWIADWPEFRGLGRYNMANANRLDAILDKCHELDITVNFVIHNHGAGSNRTDREWQNSPYNKENGGPFASPASLFTDPLAMKLFDHHRRYIVGRWSGHPAVLGWKLWSEVNLTAAGNNVVSWHDHATKAWRQVDPYHRPTTSHWAGDYKNPHRGVVSLPLLDYICIDAYHGRSTLITELLFHSTAHPTRGLAAFNKPLLVTEYGGGSGGGTAMQLQAELIQGPFAAVPAGLAGTPMTWWVEFVDQRDFWSPFIAINRFMQGEDLRATKTSPARSIRLAAQAGESERELFAAAWARPGRLLGYLVDAEWGRSGLGDEDIADSHIVIAKNAKPGNIRIEWWDADTGEIITIEQRQHEGGELNISPQKWRRHLAWKLIRE